MGVKTTFGYFYKLFYGDKGIDKANLVNDCLEISDAEIKANKDAKHTQGTDQGLDTGGANAVVVADVKDAVTKKHTQGTDYSNIVICANYDHPDDAITAISTDNKTLLVTEAETCDTNFTVPANVTVKFERGGKWTINTGITVTFNGQIEAGLWQIFEYVTTGTLAGIPQVDYIFPQWFGAMGDGTTDDTTAIQNTLNSGHKNIFVPKGTYKITSDLTIGSNNISLTGEGYETEIRAFTGVTKMIKYVTVARYRLKIRDLSLNGNSVASVEGINLSNIHEAIIENVMIKNCNYGIYGTDCWSNRIMNCFIYNNTTGIYFYQEVNAISILGCIISSNGTGIYVYSGQDVNITHCQFESNTTVAIHLKSWQRGTFIDHCYHEADALFLKIDNLAAGKMVLSNSFINSGSALAVEFIASTGSRFIEIKNVFFTGYNDRTAAAIKTLDTCNVKIEDCTSYKLDWTSFPLIDSASTGNVKEINHWITAAPTTGFHTRGSVYYNITPSAGGTSGWICTASGTPGTWQIITSGYEEGEWTPGITFGGASVGITGTFSGLYTKIGRQVTITGRIDLSNKGTSTGAATITGLPFTSKDTTAADSPVSLRFSTITFANIVQGYIIRNSSTITLEEVTEAGVKTALDDTNFANLSYIVFSATYFTD